MNDLLPFAKASLHEHIQCLAYEGAIETFQNIFYGLFLVDSVIIWKEPLIRSILEKSMQHSYKAPLRRAHFQVTLRSKACHFDF